MKRVWFPLGRLRPRGRPAFSCNRHDRSGFPIVAVGRHDGGTGVREVHSVLVQRIEPSRSRDETSDKKSRAKKAFDSELVFTVESVKREYLTDIVKPLSRPALGKLNDVTIVPRVGCQDDFQAALPLRVRDPPRGCVM